MNRTVVTCALVFCSTLASAASEDRFERCREVVLVEYPGQLIKVEKKIEAGQPIYEFDIRDPQGADWDIECRMLTTEIHEVEREVDTPNVPLFKAMTKLSERRARIIALDAYPGHIVAVEYEVENAGEGPSIYEFDIATETGEQMKVEVNAATGEIGEANRQLWQIGFE
jgi:uncharacterized membrane protein YkoI